MTKQTIEEDSEYCDDPGVKQHFLKSAEGTGQQTHAAYGSNVQPRRRINRNLAIIREIEEKFEPLERYQNLINEAVKEAIGKEMWQSRSWYAQEDKAA